VVVIRDVVVEILALLQTSGDFGYIFTAHPQKLLFIGFREKFCFDWLQLQHLQLYVAIFVAQ